MDFILNPNLVLYLPLWKLDGASFMSKDTYGHLCTVTGALWRPNGRDFDGTDDSILVESPSSTTKQYTLLVWAYSHNSTSAQKYFLDIQTGRIILTWGSDTAGKMDIYIDGSWRTPQDSPSANVWHCVVCTLDGVGNVCQFYLNGEIYGLGGACPAVDIGGTIRVGSRYAISGTWHAFDGLLGEVWIYNRVLTPQEIQNIYLATRWRYR